MSIKHFLLFQVFNLQNGFESHSIEKKQRPQRTLEEMGGGEADPLLSILVVNEKEKMYRAIFFSWVDFSWKAKIFSYKHSLSL